MIKIQSSYRLIKNKDITYTEDSVPITNVNIKNPIVEKVPNKELFDDTIDIKDIGIDNLMEDLENKLRAEIEEERQTILNNALNEAKVEIEELKKDAVNKGYEEGYKKGRDEGIQQALKDCEESCNEIKQDALKLIKQSEVEVDNYFNESKESIIDLAGVMAESIVHKTIDTSDEKIISLIKPILEQYEGKENIILTCNPDSVEFLKDNIKKLQEINPESRFIILEDNNLEKNGCTIENESQITDLQIGNQINSIIQDLKNMED